MIRLDYSAFREVAWYQYAVRFFIGGLITVLAGAVAMQFGPAVGGLFLAFPAIFPATATLVEKHERQKGTGMLAFAGIVWQFLPRHAPWLVLTGATLSWMTVSFSIWAIRKYKPWRRYTP
jgi:hypothetical protein